VFIPGTSRSSEGMQGVRAARLITYPWPHLIVDNFLSTSVLARTLAEINPGTHGFEIEYRGSGRIEFSLLKSKTLWKAIYSKRTIQLLSAAFDSPITLNRDNWIQMRRMNAETPEFPIHSDFDSDQFSVASFLYLSEGWAEERGGRLNLFATEDDHLPATSISPIQNRFVAFQTRDQHWHSVEKAHDWERLSALALWNCEFT
jgi:hypothetical protein